MKTADKLGYRIPPEHEYRLKWFLRTYYHRADWQFYRHDHDSHAHLVASKRTQDIAHAFIIGLQTADIHEHILSDLPRES